MAEVQRLPMAAQKVDGRASLDRPGQHLATNASAIGDEGDTAPQIVASIGEECAVVGALARNIDFQAADIGNRLIVGFRRDEDHIERRQFGKFDCAGMADDPDQRQFRRGRNMAALAAQHNDEIFSIILVPFRPEMLNDRGPLLFERLG